MRSDRDEKADAWSSFEAALARPVHERIARGILSTFKPVLDEGPGVRVFATIEEYRRWCESALPDWLGYRRVSDREWQRMIEDAMREPASPVPGAGRGRG
jgi:hypothetical protein